MSFLISIPPGQLPLPLTDVGVGTFCVAALEVNYDLETVFTKDELLNSQVIADGIDNNLCTVIVDGIPITQGIHLRPYLLRTGKKPMLGDLDMNGYNIINWSGGGGSTTFAGLTDVNFTFLANGQTIEYDSGTGKWINVNSSSTPYTNGAGLDLTGSTFSISLLGVTNAMLAGSIAASKLIGTDIATVGTITSGIWHGSAIGDSYISSASNWNTAYSSRIATFTTTGSSGAATFSSNTLNIPNYTLAGLGGQPLATNLTSLAGLSYASLSFVKMSASGTFSLDTNTYLTTISGLNISSLTNDSGYITSAALSGYLLSSTAALTYFPIPTGITSQYLRGDGSTATFPTIPSVGTWGALNYPTWVSGTPFVKMTATGTFALDTNTYLTGNQSITLSGEASGTGTTSISVTLANSSVISKVLTGYTSGAGTISSSDSILSAIQKLNGNIAALSTPTLAQVLAVGAATGQTLITSNNLYATLKILNTEAAIYYSDGGTTSNHEFELIEGSVKIEFHDITNNVNSYLRFLPTHTNFYSEVDILFDAPNYNFTNQTASRIAGWDSSRNLISLDTTTYPSLTELSYVKGVTSSIQTQINSKQASATNLTSLSGLSYSSLAFVKMSGSGTFTLDTTSYYSASNPSNYIALTALSSTATGLTYTNTTGVFSLTTGYVIPTTTEETNWNTAYSNRIDTFTTTGSSGAATFSGNTLNIPNYTLAGLNGQPLATNLTSLAGLSYVSASFVKMTASGTFSLDTNTYLTSLSGALLATGATTGATSQQQTFTNGIILGTNTSVLGTAKFFGSTSGDVTVQPNAVAGTSIVLTLPATTGTVALTSNIGTWGALNYPTYVSGTPFVKMTSAGTFSLDTSTYLTSVGTGTTNEITYWSGTNTLGSLTTATYPSLTELSYVKGVTSAIQTQFTGKIDKSVITAQGDIIYGSGASTPTVLAKDTNATRYLSNQGTSNNPSWNQVNLANGVTGTLPTANGGMDTATYHTILQAQGWLNSATTANTFWLVTGTSQINTCTSGGSGNAIMPAMIYISSSDYPTVNGLAPKLRIRANLYVNNTAPTGTWTFGLYPMTSPGAGNSGGVGVRAHTIGTVVSGSNGASQATPAAATNYNLTSSDFALPANGWYAICIVTNATIATNSTVQLDAKLQLHNA